MESWRRELYENSLYHYGVKGMKWGEHKFGEDDLDPDEAKKESDSIEQQLIDLVRSGRKGNIRATSSQSSSETKRMLDGLKEAKTKEYRARLIKNSNKAPSDLSENEYKAATNSAMKDAEKYVSQLVKDYEIDTSSNYDEERIKKQMTHSELYHYGTKHHSGRYPYGSGDRPYQDREVARAERYKEKEINAIKTRMARYGQIQKSKSQKIESQYRVAASKGASEKKLNKIANKYERIMTDTAREAFFSSAEMDRIRSMSIKDIKQEKMKVAKEYATSIAMSAASVSVAMLTPMPVGFIYPPNTARAKRANRITNQQAENILKTSAQAGHAVRRSLETSSKPKNTIAMLTADEAKKLGYGENTRLSKEEESAMWKAMAAEIERKNRK